MSMEAIQSAWRDVQEAGSFYSGERGAQCHTPDSWKVFRTQMALFRNVVNSTEVHSLWDKRRKVAEPYAYGAKGPLDRRTT